MKPSSLAFGITVAVFTSNTSVAEVFQSAAQCEERVENLLGEARQFDRAWMDCVAGAAHYTVKDCRQMHSESKVIEMRRLAHERDRLHSQAEILKPICSGMARDEKEEKNRQQRALAEEEQSRKISEKRRSMSVEQYQKDRETERRVFDNAKQKEEERRNYSNHQREQTEKDNEEKNKTINSQALNTLNDISMREFGTHATLTPDSDTQTYNAIQNGAQTLHRLVQNKQPKAVTKIQNEAWKAVRIQHADTLKEVKSLSETIDSVNSETPQPSTSHVKTTPSYSAPTAAPTVQNDDENLEVALQEIGNGNYTNDSSESKANKNKSLPPIASKETCPSKESVTNDQAFRAELTRINKLEPKSRRCAQAQLDLKIYQSLLSSQASCKNRDYLANLEQSALNSEKETKKLCRK